MDVAALRAALADVVGRHEARCVRRLVADATASSPVQRVLPAAEAATRSCAGGRGGPRRGTPAPDWRPRPPLVAGCRSGLADDLLVRAARCSRPRTRRTWCATLAGLATKPPTGGRTGQLLADLAAAYTARAAGTAPSAVSAPALVTYAEYTAWQRASGRRRRVGDGPCGAPARLLVRRRWTACRTRRRCPPTGPALPTPHCAAASPRRWSRPR
ncbi:hypothetical protein ACU686_15565 [Yinghuangia aomiensis]